jgi:hypothetical protein
MGLAPYKATLLTPYAPIHHKHSHERHWATSESQSMRESIDASPGFFRVFVRLGQGTWIALCKAP